jgi:hypothetical protein
MKPPKSSSVRRRPICRHFRVLTDISAIIIAGLDCVKPENYGFFPFALAVEAGYSQKAGRCVTAIHPTWREGLANSGLICYS